jgi:hypothetical protein
MAGPPWECDDFVMLPPVAGMLRSNLPASGALPIAGNWRFASCRWQQTTTPLTAPASFARRRTSSRTKARRSQSRRSAFREFARLVLCERILRIAAERAAKKSGPKFASVTNVGDGVWDVVTAKALGWRFIRTAAGYQAKRLCRADAGIIVADYCPSAALLTLLLRNDETIASRRTLF